MKAPSNNKLVTITFLFGIKIWIRYVIIDVPLCRDYSQSSLIRILLDLVLMLFTIAKQSVHKYSF